MVFLTKSADNEVQYNKKANSEIGGFKVLVVLVSFFYFVSDLFI